MNHSLINSFTWSLCDKLINQIGFLAVTIYLAKIIGPESFGLIGILSIFLLFFENVVNYGFSQALIQKSHSMTEQDASSVFYVSLTLGITIYTILCLLAPIFSEFYKQPLLTKISYILFLTIIINSLTVVTKSKLIIALNFKHQMISTTLSNIISSAIAILLITKNYNYWALIWLIVLKSLFNSIGLWFFCNWYPKFIFCYQSFRSIFRFSSSLMLVGVISTLLSNISLLVIGKYYNSSHAGYFNQATNLTNSLSSLISSTLQGTSYPFMTEIKEDKIQLKKIYIKLISTTALVSLPLLIGFSAIADNFIILFLGDKWLPVLPIVSALCIARTITPIITINMNILNTIGRPDLFLKTDLCSLPLILIALYLAIPYGVTSLAWSITFISFISFFVSTYFPGKFFNFGAISQLKIAYKYIISSAIMYFIVKYISVDNLPVELFVKIFSGILSYSIMLILLRDEFFMNQIRNFLCFLKKVH